MPKKILLVFQSDPDNTISIETLPPLGILYIASYLESNGIPTDVIDYAIDPKAEIKVEDYELIGFSINISNRDISLEKISEIKRQYPQQKIVVGGPLCISNPELFFENQQIDAVFSCEGEEALYEYLTNDSMDSVKGIYIKHGSGKKFTGIRPRIKELDKLPFPAFSKVELRKYNNYPKQAKPLASIITSRGCPYECIFCAHSMGTKWRARSADNVVRTHLKIN